MTNYHNLLQHILDNGTDKTDRTGTGTRSVFGYQLRYDLSKGFPLVTTKKVHLKSIIYELLWFLKGDTNVKYLNDNGVSIWDSWADENGDLGAVYGRQWVSWGANKVNQLEPKIPEGYKATYLGVANGDNPQKSNLKKTWEGMISRCYDKKSKSYPTYGGIGVSVCNEWLAFENFARDAVMLENYDLKEKDKNTRYVLDKDLKGSGFLYSPETCTWLTDEQNMNLNLESRIITVENKQGEVFSFSNVTKFCAEHNIDSKNFSDLWTKNKNARTRYGFRLISIEHKPHKRTGIDQISEVIEQIKNNPDSRRLIVSAWNVAEIQNMALAPCHAMFQFYVANGKLSLHLYQRSADAFLGVPFNIASYALLLMMVAQVCDLEVGEYIHTFGDVHIYNNHFEQVNKQLQRTPKPLPTMKLTPEIKNIFDFDFEDFTLENYEPYPGIKAPVAV